MKAMFTSSVLVTFILFLSFQDKSKKEIRPSSFQLYCCSFVSCDDTSSPFTMMFTVTNVRPEQLIAPKYLIKSSSKKQSCKQLYDLVFNSPKKVINKGFKGVDARMVIIINYSNKASDTITYSSKDMLCPNDSEYFKYDFNILKSLRRSLGIKECFNCVRDMN